MENQEAQVLGENLDLEALRLGWEPPSATLQLSGSAIESTLSNATVTSQTQLFKFRFTLINIKKIKLKIQLARCASHISRAHSHMWLV